MQPDTAVKITSFKPFNDCISRFGLCCPVRAHRAWRPPFRPLDATSPQIRTSPVRPALGDRLHRRALRDAMGGAVRLPGGAVRAGFRDLGRTTRRPAWRMADRQAGQARDHRRRAHAWALSWRRLLVDPQRPACWHFGADRGFAAAGHSDPCRLAAARKSVAAPVGGSCRRSCRRGDRAVAEAGRQWSGHHRAEPDCQLDRVALNLCRNGLAEAPFGRRQPDGQRVLAICRGGGGHARRRPCQRDRHGNRQWRADLRAGLADAWCCRSAPSFC